MLKSSPMLAKISPLILMLTCLSQPAIAHEGGERGGGDNPDPAKQAAWFSGNQAIRYCIELSPAFGTTETAATAQIEAAFQTWTKYLNDKQVISDRTRSQAGNANYLPLATHLQKISGCDGSQDLSFYLGTENAAVKKAKSEFENPVGFAVSESFDVSKQWGHGFIWVANQGSVFPNPSSSIWNYPNWSIQNELRAVLLHELGHVFGNGHILGTIMASDFSERLKDEPGNLGSLGPWAEQIDDASELWSCEHCPSKGLISRNLQQANAAFLLFTGKAPKGNVRAELSEQPKAELRLIDDTGSYPVAFGFGSTASATDCSMVSIENEMIFSQAVYGSGVIGRHLDMGVCYTTAKDAQGKKRIITFDFNMPTGTSNASEKSATQIRYFDHGIRKDLFLKTN